MLSRRLSLAVFFVVFVAASLDRYQTEARMLPTRGNGDRVDKLRELLKELLETEIEKEEYQADAPPRWHPESKLFYKREAPADAAPAAAGANPADSIH